MDSPTKVRMVGGFVSIEIHNDNGIIIRSGDIAIVDLKLQRNLLDDYILSCTASSGSKNISRVQIMAIITALQAMHDKMK